MSQEKIGSQGNESLRPNEIAAERMTELAEKFDEALVEKGTESEILEQARKDTEKHARSAEQQSIASEVSSSNDGVVRTKADRQSSYSSTIKSMQQRLTGNERAFSKVIHQKTVERTSEIAEKTIGRSSLLLGAFSVTFIGTLVIYIVSRRNGYVIDNYAYIVVLFVVGAIAGLLLEYAGNMRRNK